MVLNAENTYTGDTTIHAGTLEIGASGSPGTGYIVFAPGGGATLRIDSATAPTNIIEGFVIGDGIDLHGLAYNAAYTPSYSGSIGEMQVLDGQVVEATLYFDPGNSALTGNFHITNVGGDTFITNDAPCFAAGTRIRAEHGDVAVEDLLAGDLILTHDGRLRPIVWTGRRHIDLTRHPHPERARPVRIRAGAIAQGVPVRDLLVSPDHALFLDGVLIPARLLVNGHSIAVETTRRHVTYHHIELASYDVILAEGLPAESYLDTGDRASSPAVP